MASSFESVPVWMMVLGFALMLGPLITLHELGHYLVGRWFGVGANVFSIGFGKEIAGLTDSRGTRWRLSAIPLGGYVQFAGDMSPSSQPTDEYLALPPAEREKCFQSKPLWQKALIVAAGPVTNVLIAALIFAGFIMAYGKPVSANPEQENYIVAFAEQSPAREAGIEIGDRIIAVEGEATENFRSVQLAIMLYPNKQLDVTVDRAGQSLTIPVTTRAEEMTDQFGNSSTIGLIGVEGRPGEVIREDVGPLAALGYGFAECWDMLKMMLSGIGQIFMGERSVKEMGGMGTIAKYSGEQLSLGWVPFISLVAMISLNLAFINLLPIPVLDGGHLAFYAAEAIRRKPVSARSQELAYRTGLALVVALVLFVNLIDVAKFTFWGS